MHRSPVLFRANFPIDTTEAFFAALPAGAGTTCQAGDVTITTEEAGALLKLTGFPFLNAQ